MKRGTSQNKDDREMHSLPIYIMGPGPWTGNVFVLNNMKTLMNSPVDTDF